MKLSLTLYAAVALSFLLPFGTVSCDSDHVTVTGMQLVTRSVPGAGSDDVGPNLAQQVEDGGAAPAVLCLVAVLSALGLAWTRHLGWRFVAALSALLLLLWLPVKAAASLADVQLGVGFLLGASLLLVANGVEIRRLVHRRRVRKGRLPTPTRAELVDAAPPPDFTAP